MKQFLEFINEAKVSIKNDRYVRSHSKNPPSTRGRWMFTSIGRGDVDYKDDKTVFSFNGDFKEASDKAKEWANKNGHSIIYVME